MNKQDTDVISRQVMWNRLISLVEEQAQALIRTAFSTSVREAGDLSAGVYNEAGQMLAQAVTGTPGHVNAMADAVAHFIQRIGRDDMYEGDVYVTNDPWKGTGHLHDITVVTPSFFQGRLIGFFGCTAHVVDIGGRGFNADAQSIYEEGFYIPIMKLAARGEIDKTLISLLRQNVREPDQVVGDIYALSVCNEIGHKRLISMLEEFELQDLTSVSDFILAHSHAAICAKIAALPPGVGEGEMTIDGYSRPVQLKARIEIKEETVSCDFSGSSGIDRNGINVPLVYTKAYACYALKCAIAPEIPNNAASLAPFVITAPENTIVNAHHPAPVALRHVIGQMVPDTVFNALDQVLPGVVPAEGAGALCNFQISLRPRRDVGANAHQGARAEVLTFNSGGAGARPGVDGLNATAFPSGVMTMPVEATEHTGPVVIWRKELRPDSGGAGTYRGGLGQLMEIGARDGYEFDFSAMFDRVSFPARGRQGGLDGAPTEITKGDGTKMKGKGKQSLAHGEHVRLSFPGGGGYGSPGGRDPVLLCRDIQRGYVSTEGALKTYGVSAEELSRLLEEGDTRVPDRGN